MHLSNNVYNILKWIVAIVLPAVGACYWGLAVLWGWDNAAQVVGTIALITTFLGAVIGVSTASYNKSDSKYDGTMTVNTTVDPEKADVFQLELNDDPIALAAKSSIAFKVVNSQ